MVDERNLIDVRPGVEEPVDTAAGGEEADVAAEPLAHLPVGVEVRAGAAGVHELQVVAVQEGVLHDLPIGRLIEHADPVAVEAVAWYAEGSGRDAEA